MSATVLLALLLLPQVQAASPVCDTQVKPADLTEAYFVPQGHEKVYFHETPGGAAEKAYVVAGDLLLAAPGPGTDICAHYFKKGRMIATGWIGRADVVSYPMLSFGSFETRAETDKLQAVNSQIADAATRLPPVTAWAGRWRDQNNNVVRIIRTKDGRFALNTDYIKGRISTGNDAEDNIDLNIQGALAISRNNTADPKASALDVCDIVIAGFNNALIATSGTECMGTGGDESWPSFVGVYWKM